MDLIRIGTAALLMSCFVCLCFGQAREAPSATSRNAATEKSGEARDLARTTTPKLSTNTASATGNAEVALNVVIDPGSSVSIDSSLDYSSAITVAIAVQCMACATAATSLGTLGLVLQARWMVPNGESFVATDSRSASAFPYWDAGGAIFDVYGTQFRLTLQNKGSQAITLQQVTLLQRSQ
jgi:hypothetical protein